MNLHELDELIECTPKDISKHDYNGWSGLARIVPKYGRKRGYIDGDTLRVVFKFRGQITKKTIRLLGINTPETFQAEDHAERKKGNLAKDYLKSLCRVNQHEIIYLELGKLDAFGRILGTVYQIYLGETPPVPGTEKFGSTLIHRGKNSVNDQILQAGHAVRFVK